MSVHNKFCDCGRPFGAEGLCITCDAIKIRGILSNEERQEEEYHERKAAGL